MASSAWQCGQAATCCLLFKSEESPSASRSKASKGRQFSPAEIPSRHALSLLVLAVIPCSPRRFLSLCFPDPDCPLELPFGAHQVCLGAASVRKVQHPCNDIQRKVFSEVKRKDHPFSLFQRLTHEPMCDLRHLLALDGYIQSLRCQIR